MEPKLGILRMDPTLQPFADDLMLRMDNYARKRASLLGPGQTLRNFANGHLYFGIHKTRSGWVYREWAPNAEAAALVGDFNDWNVNTHRMQRLDGGVWEISLPKNTLQHGQNVKVRFFVGGQWLERIPAYMNRVTQSWSDGSFSGQIWDPEQPFTWTDSAFFKKIKPNVPLVYETHIGMANEEERIGTYREFMENVLPRVKQDGYNCIQLMAIMEHPYYASFGYQVSSLFAPSSRFGTPDELKELINTAHNMGISVLLDIVHSHTVKNEVEGLGKFDGSDNLYCLSGERGYHKAWDTRLFDYGKNEVLHFLLSNCKYWIEEFHFDGFRFDGVTSMLYHDHGLGTSFDCYEKYFSMNTNTEAVTYLQLANELIHNINPVAITIAEDMSGMPGMCLPIRQGGIGFDYRLSMGVPDFWIKTLKNQRDEQWDIGQMWHTLTSRRRMEKTVGYCESHDQALVGDKTIMFWLADAAMYWHMGREDDDPQVQRAMDYHKLIRLVTSTLAGEGYLNFMGNEFGHPEWIDFPREGNGDSGKYARRQWSLADSPELKYQYLLRFDQAMLQLLQRYSLLEEDTQLYEIRDKVLICRRGDAIFVYNFHTWAEQQIVLPKETGELVLFTNAPQFGGKNRPHKVKDGVISLPPRTACVFERKL
ncbi:MAG: 1,4-alpha-glucan-branching enzyme [Ruminococcaceae bacterium]|nr:1,4-alpha-glucan-branching enzyme [Oscillospiraceae bacterium]